MHASCAKDGERAFDEVGEKQKSRSECGRKGASDSECVKTD